MLQYHTFHGYPANQTNNQGNSFIFFQDWGSPGRGPASQGAPISAFFVFVFTVFGFFNRHFRDVWTFLYSHKSFIFLPTPSSIFCRRRALLVLAFHASEKPHCQFYHDFRMTQHGWSPLSVAVGVTGVFDSYSFAPKCSFLLLNLLLCVFSHPLWVSPNDFGNIS